MKGILYYKIFFCVCVVFLCVCVSYKTFFLSQTACHYTYSSQVFVKRIYFLSFLLLVLYYTLSTISLSTTVQRLLGIDLNE